MYAMLTSTSESMCVDRGWWARLIGASVSHDAGAEKKRKKKKTAFARELAHGLNLLSGVR